MNTPFQFAVINSHRIMSYRIEPREEIEVYLTQNGQVCIKQISMMADEAHVFVHHEDVPKLIEHLEAVRQEALDFVPDTEDEEASTQ
jgi:hypothetical protein